MQSLSKNLPVDQREMQKFLVYGFNKDPQCLSDDSRARTLDRLNRYACLDIRGITLNCFLGRGAHGIVLGGEHWAKGPCAVKLVTLHTEHQVEDFKRECTMQMVMYEHIPDLVVEVRACMRSFFAQWSALIGPGGQVTGQ